MKDIILWLVFIFLAVSTIIFAVSPYVEPIWFDIGLTTTFFYGIIMCIFLDSKDIHKSLKGN